MLDEGIPLFAEQTELLESNSLSTFDEGLPLISNFAGSTYNRKTNHKNKRFKLWSISNLLLILQLTNVTCASALSESNISITEVSPTTLTWYEPLNITVYFDNTKCENLQWLQFSHKLGNNVLARDESTYKSEYKAYLHYYKTLIMYTLQIQQVDFEHLRADYRVDCESKPRTKSINIHLLESHLILIPERLQRLFFIENATLDGTVTLENMFPQPTKFSIVIKTLNGRVFTINNTIPMGSTSQENGLVNKTFVVREPIEKDICTCIVSVTIFVDHIALPTFSDQISSGCSLVNGSSNHSFISIILPVILVIVVVVTLIVIYKLRHKSIPFCRQNANTSSDDSEIQEQVKFMKNIS